MASDDVFNTPPSGESVVDSGQSIVGRIWDVITSNAKTLITVYPILWLVLFAVVPALVLFAMSFFPKPSGEYYSIGFTVEHYVRILDGNAIGYIVTTLYIAVITAIFCMILAFPMAYGLSRIYSPTQRRNYLLVIIATMWLTVIIRAYAVQLLFSSEGIINRFLVGTGLAGEPVLSTTGFVTVIAGMVYGFLPFALLTMYASIHEVEQSLEDASLNLGANRLQTIWRVTIHQSYQGIALAGGLVFILASGSYVVPQLLGDPNHWTIPVLITQQISEQLNVPYAAALSIVFILLIDGLFLVGYWLYKRLGKVSAGASNGESVLHGIDRRISRGLGAVPDQIASKVPFALRLYLWVMLALFVIPLVVVVSVSFTSSSFMTFPPQGFSTQWFEQIAGTVAWREAMLTSLLVAIGAAAIATSIGGTLAYALDRYDPPFATYLTALGIVPLLIPPVIVAVAYTSYFLQIGIWGTMGGIMIAHGVVFSTFAFALVRNGLLDIDQHVEEAAAILGASQQQIARTVTLPLLSSSIFSAVLFAFVLSLNEYIIAFFVAGFGLNTIPMEIFASLRYNYSPVIAAVSVIYIVLTTVVVVVIDRWFTLSLWD